MRSNLTRVLVIIGGLALVGVGCGEGDSDTDATTGEVSAVAGSGNARHADGADPVDEVEHTGEAENVDDAEHAEEAEDADEAKHADDAERADETVLAEEADSVDEHGDEAEHGDEPEHGDVVDPVGGAGPADGVDMVVEIVMTEFAFEMDDLAVPVGSTVRFDFVNEGVIEHEAMFGNAHQQEEFAEMGGRDGGHHGDEGHHGEDRAITLGATASGSLTVTFDEPGELMIGCHLPSHWDAGMFATFVVA